MSWCARPRRRVCARSRLPITIRWPAMTPLLRWLPIAASNWFARWNLARGPDEQREDGKRERSVHVLGYWLSSEPTAEFRRYLETQQASRRKRNVDLVAKLQQLGVSITLEDAEVYGRNQVGRPHFARVLLEKGYVKNLQQAFDVYLADEAQAGVERDEPTLDEGIRRIKEGGGMASLAHPIRLPQRGPDLERLVEQLLDAGLEGIEVFPQRAYGGG